MSALLTSYVGRYGVNISILPAVDPGRSTALLLNRYLKRLAQTSPPSKLKVVSPYNEV